MNTISRRKFLASVPASLGFVGYLNAERVSRRVLSMKTNPIVALTEANTKFGSDLFGRLAKAPGNHFVSPISVSSALAMASLGARGQTLTEMITTLQLPKDETTTDQGYAELLAQLNGVGLTEQQRGFNLKLSNRLWGQKGMAWQPEFLNRAKNFYQAELETVDFAGATEIARQIINRSIEKDTNNKIKELIKQGVVNVMTRLVLTNAVYFKAAWQNTFSKERTTKAKFTDESNKVSQVEMMAHNTYAGYAETDQFQILRLAYQGRQTAMTILLPRRPEGIKALEQNFSKNGYPEMVNLLKQEREVNIFLPKFKIESEYMLKDPLSAAGMKLAFSDQADFSGVSLSNSLSISEVVHKTYVDVNEAETEAAAATAIIMRATSMPVDPPPTFRADRPFLFVIDHLPSKSMLFVGRFSNG